MLRSRFSLGRPGIIGARRRGAPAWTPAQLSLQTWQESDQGITIATGVSQWDDLSGNGNHLTQGTGTRQPTVVGAVLNGIQGIQFDGVDDLMVAPAFARTAPSTVFMVLRPETWTANDFIFEAGSTSAFGALQRVATPTISANSGALLDNANLAVGSFALLTVIFNGVSSVIQVQSTAESTGDTGVNAANGYTLAARPSTTGFSNITVMLNIVMNGVASIAQRDALKAYVLGKYGI